MTLSAASQTARRTATFRAQHQRFDPVRILEDPFAIPLLGDDASEPLDSPPAPERTATRLYVAARARLAEELLAAAVADGVSTYVVLGAGLDTFALRNPHPGLRVLEIDHPATQAWKRERLERAGLALPEGSRFVPVDFVRDDLARSLREAGLDPRQRAFFSWLGVSYYLSREAIQETLSSLAAACSPGSGLVLDFYAPPETLDEGARRRLEHVAARVAAVGEPFVSFFTPAELTTLLEAHGFGAARTFDGSELVARYLDGTAARLGFARLAHAVTAPSGAGWPAGAAGPTGAP